jgi:uncharacterized membrane protein (UPF0127 family)
MRIFKLSIPVALALFGTVMLSVQGFVAIAQTAPNPVALTVDGREAQELWIKTGQGRFRFTAEIADEASERSQGLMFRESMPETHGMLFDFKESRSIQMWMRNTPLPLDMVFADSQGRVVRIAERTTPFSDAIIDSGGPVAYVLEINAGISRMIGIKPGDQLEYQGLEKTEGQ